MANKYKKYLTLLCVSLMGFLCMFYDTGPAATVGQAVTGAPFDNGGQYCSSCHGGAHVFNTTVSMQLLDASSNVVTTYIPGNNYTLKITLNGTGLPATVGYGFQVMCTFSGTNANINTWGSLTGLPITVHNTLLNGRNYVEHGAKLTTNVMNIPWTAPSGTTDIVFYAAGNIVNGDGGDGGDDPNKTSLTVSPNCTPITVTPATLPNGTTGTAYNQSLSQTSGVAPVTYAVTSGSLPTGLSLSTAGVISGTPNASGPYSFTVTATGSNGCTGTINYSVTIGCPTITVNPSALAAATAGTAYNATITEAGSNGSTFTYSLVSGALPTGLTMTAGGVISGTPLAGASNFTIQVLDNYGCTATRAYSLNPSCPTATLSPATLTGISVGVAYSQAITQSGGSGTYTYTKTGILPPGVTLSTTGQLSGTPTTSGNYSFTVTATNQFGCTGTQGYSLAVSCPTIILNPATLPAGSAGVAYGTQSFTTTGSSGASTTYAVTTGTLPTGLTLSTAGALSGIPSSGNYNFTVTATDNFGCTASNAYTVSVTCPTITITPASLPGVATGGSYNQTISQTGGSGTFTYTVTTGAVPTGLTLSTAGVLSGTATTTGTYNFTVKGSNAFGCSSTASYSIAVACPAITVNPATIGNINVGSTVNQAITQTGGSGAYTYSVTAGTLPAGLTLSAAGVLSGTPTATATSNFTITATSGSCTGSNAYTVNVVCPTTTFAPATLPNVPIGGAYSQAITQTGGTGTYTYTITSGALPAGITLATTGMLSGMTTLGGLYTFAVSAANQYGCTTTNSYTVNVTCPTLLLTASLPNSNIGVPYNQTITQTGGSGVITYAVTTGALPTGVTLATNGVLSGTPSVNGTYNFTVKATDGFGCSGTQSYTIIISCPSITLTASLPNASKGVVYSQAISQTGSTGTVTYAVTTGNLPTGLTLAANGTLAGTPTVNGTYAFTVTGTNGSACTGTQSYTIIVSCPIITLSPTTLPNNNLGATYSHTITQSGGSGTTTFAVSTGALPTGLTLAANGAITGSTTTNGTYNFTVRATDAFGCTGTQLYTVIVSCPTMTISPATLPNVLIGSTYSQAITQTGATGTITYTVSAGALPTGVTLAANGTLSGTASVNGTYNFTIKATDAFGCTGTQIYTVIVSCPVITVTPATLPNATIGSTYSQTISQTGSTGTVTYAVTTGSLPTGLTLAANGAITGTVTTNGVYNFTITATNSLGCTSTQSYSVTVSCPTITISPATLPNANIGSTYNQAISQTGASGTITYTVSTGSLPTGLTLAANGTISGIATTNGTYNFTIKAANGASCSSTQAYTVVIACPAITLSPATLPNVTVNNAYTQPITQTGGVGTITYAVSSGTLPVGITLAANGTLSGTSGASGSYTFTVTATDNFGCIGTQTYTVIVSCPLITIAPATLPDVSAGAAYSQTITETGGVGTMTYALLAGTPPPGITLAANGALSGTALTSGTYNFSMTATDDLGCIGYKAYGITVTCPTISLSPATLPVGNEDSVYSQMLSQTGSTGSLVTYTVSSGSLPAGISLALTGLLAGIPTAQGTYTFDIAATDEFGCTANQTYTIIIGAPVSVKTILANGDGISVVALLPNTVSKETTAQITCSDACSATVTVVDITGRTMYQDNIALHAGTNNIKYDFSSLKAGIYTFHVTPGNTKPIKFVKL